MVRPGGRNHICALLSVTAYRQVPSCEVPPISLSDFIRANREPILVEWEAFARTCKPAAESMDGRELRDHADRMLNWIADDLETAQTERQGDEKAKGNAEESEGETVASRHGLERYHDQFTLPQIFGEFRALRASVINLWTQHRENANADELRDLTRFNEAIDQVVAESVERFAASLEESKDMFAAILGHDLRNPLAAILTGASYLQATLPQQTEQEAVASRIFTSGKRMGRLISDILDFSRTRLGGEFPISPRAVNMEEVCREIVNEVVAGHPDRVIHFECTGNVSGTWDRERVGQVTSNLIANALQHGERSTEISVALSGEAEEVLLTVHNWGPVISAEDVATIFDPVKRLAPAGEDASRQGSLGLGLHIVQLVIQAHEGHIEVDSTRDRGTTFTARWPK